MIIIILLSLNLCSAQRPITVTRNADLIERDAEIVNVKYKLPQIFPTSSTSQSKGNITISVEIEPFHLIRENTTSEKVIETNNSEFDRFEVTNSPSYTVTPNTVNYRIKITNNLNSILSLKTSFLEIKTNSVTCNNSTIAESISKYLQSEVLPGAYQTFIIAGQEISSIQENAILSFIITNIPIKINDGKIKKQDNFEWLFRYESVERLNSDSVTFSYNNVPVESEVCSLCRGLGTLSIDNKCTVCNGDGLITGKKGKTTECYYCGGDGVVTSTMDCSNKLCDNGKMYHPKSKVIPITETWVGYSIKVTTVPPGMPVLIISPENVDASHYNLIGSSPIEFNWLNKEGKRNPIKIKYEDSEIEVIPYNEKGKIISEIIVDFSNPQNPIVKEGKRIY